MENKTEIKLTSFHKKWFMFEVVEDGETIIQEKVYVQPVNHLGTIGQLLRFVQESWKENDNKCFFMSFGNDLNENSTNANLMIVGESAIKCLQ